MTFETLSRIQVRFRSELHQVDLRPLRYRQLPGYIMDRTLRHDARPVRAELALVVAVDGWRTSSSSTPCTRRRTTWRWKMSTHALFDAARVTCSCR
jgi:hypothetical protein